MNEGREERKGRNVSTITDINLFLQQGIHSLDCASDTETQVEAVNQRHAKQRGREKGRKEYRTKSHWET